MSPQAKSDAGSSATALLSTTSVTMTRVGSTNQFTGSYSEDGPSGNPNSFTRDFRCTLSTGETLDDMDHVACNVSAGGSGNPLPHAETDPVINLVQKQIDMGSQVDRPTGGWPTTISFNFSAQVTFGS